MHTTIIIIADAWTHRLFHECLGGSLLPELEDELLGQGAAIVDAISIFPSVSLSSHTTILTRSNQNRHGIPGHRWFDRELGETVNYIGTGVGKVNRDISKEVSTLFEDPRFTDSMSIQGIINRGAARSVRYPFLSSTSILKHAAEEICRNPESLYVVWLPKGDIVSHLHGPYSSQMVSEMRETSRGIGLFIRKIRREIGLDNIKLLLTSDHGQTEVRNHVSINSLCARVLRSGAAPKSSRFRQKKNWCICTSGESIAYLYLLGSDPSPDFREALVRELARSPGIGIIFHNIGNSVVKVHSNEGTARIEATEDGSVYYSLLEGSDPLSLLEPPQKNESMDISRASSRYAYNRYPDIIHQYLTSVCGRAGDILICADKGCYFGDTPRIGWRLGYFKGSHGGPSRDEMLIPAILLGHRKDIPLPRVVRTKDLMDALM